MAFHLQEFVTAVGTLFVVANVAPILPLALRFTEDAGDRRARVLLRALVVGNVVALGVALGGRSAMAFARLEIADVQIAGGLILLVFSVHDLLFSQEQRKEALGPIVDNTPGDGIVPLALPLLVGPATLATVLVVAETNGQIACALALLCNALVNAGILLGGGALIRLVGQGTLRAIGKVMGLVLASLAVSMIRTGIQAAAAST